MRISSTNEGRKRQEMEAWEKLALQGGGASSTHKQERRHRVEERGPALPPWGRVGGADYEQGSQVQVKVRVAIRCTAVLLHPPGAGTSARRRAALTGRAYAGDDVNNHYLVHVKDEYSTCTCTVDILSHWVCILLLRAFYFMVHAKIRVLRRVNPAPRVAIAWLAGMCSASGVKTFYRLINLHCTLVVRNEQAEQGHRRFSLAHHPFTGGRPFAADCQTLAQR